MTLVPKNINIQGHPYKRRWHTRSHVISSTMHIFSILDTLFLSYINSTSPFITMHYSPFTSISLNIKKKIILIKDLFV